MDTINQIVSENLRQLREQRKLSLDALSRLSGVSKSMLGLIERGDVTPTIATVWKICNGLKISFTELLHRQEADIEVVSKEDIQPFVELDGHFRNYPMFHFDSDRRFEVFNIELDAGRVMEAEAHPEGTQEFITVFSGVLRVVVDKQTLTVGSGGSMRFRADRPHSYENIGAEPCHHTMLIYYPQ